MSTLSANLTREGLDLSLAFLAADRRADFRVEDWKKKTIVKWKFQQIVDLFRSLFWQGIEFQITRAIVSMHIWKNVSSIVVGTTRFTKTLTQKYSSMKTFLYKKIVNHNLTSLSNKCLTHVVVFSFQLNLNKNCSEVI